MRTTLCFNPRAPRGARPVCQHPLIEGVVVSIHAPRAGRDTTRATRLLIRGKFQSTRPARGATTALRTATHLQMFQSTRPARGATRLVDFQCGQLCVSIHAPRAGRDAAIGFDSTTDHVSIHAPRAGRDRPWPTVGPRPRPFQSTRPARGATNVRDDGPDCGVFQSTRPARGAT